MRARLWALMLCSAVLFRFGTATAQVATGYTWSQATGGAYTALGTANSNALFADSWDDDDVTLTLPFTFTYNNTAYTQITVSSNGFFVFGGTLNANNSGEAFVSGSDASGLYLGGTGTNNGVAFFNADMADQSFTAITGRRTSGSTSITNLSSTTDLKVGMRLAGTGIPSNAVIISISGTTATLSVAATSGSNTSTSLTPRSNMTVQVTGTSPNRTYIIQAARMARFNLDGVDDVSYQVKLAEGGGNAANQTISILYGTCTSTNNNNNAPVQVGIRTAITDFNSRTTTSNWSSTSAGAANTDRCRFRNGGIVPASGLSYTWTPNFCTGTPTAGTIGGTSPICSGSSSTLTLTGMSTAPYGLSTAWSYGTVSGGPYGTSAGSGNSISTGALTSTRYYVATTTCSNGGASATTAQFAVVVNAAPTSNAGPDQTTCISSPAATLAANNPSPGTGAWTVLAGSPSTSSAQFSSTTSPTATFTPAAGAGTYTLRWTVSNSPCANATDDVAIIVNAPAATAAAGPDQTICATASAALAANSASPGTGAWTALAGSPSTLSTQFSSTTSATATFTPAGGAGTYTLRWTTSRAPCASTQDDVVITVNPAPTASDAGPDQTICTTTTSVILAANNPGVGTGAWSVQPGSPSTSSAQFSSTTDRTATFTPAAGAGTYTLRWTISNSPCTASTNDVAIIVKAPPSAANAGPDQSICASTGTATMAATNPSSGAGAWSFVSGPSTPTITTPSSRTSGITGLTTAGTYTFRWTVSNSPCTATTDDMDILVKPNPTASASSNSPVCTGLDLNLTGTTNIGTSFAWSGPNSFTSTSQNPVVTGTTFSTAGTYSFTATANGCNSTVATTVVAMNEGVTASANSALSAICTNGSTTVTATATSPASFSATASTGTISVNLAASGLGTSLTTNTLAISGGNGQIGADNTVTVTLNATTGSASNSNLDFYLVGPSNCGTLELSTDNAGTGDNYAGALLRTPSAFTAISSLGNTSNVSGNFRPEGTFSTAANLASGGALGSNTYSLPTAVLQGCPVNGTWTLAVGNDNFTNAATLTGWSLTIDRTVVGNFTHVITGPGSISSVTNSGSNNATGTVTVSNVPSGTQAYTVVTTSPINSCSVTHTVNIDVTQAPNAGSDNSTTVCSDASAFDMASLLGAHDNGGAWTFGSNPHGNTFTPGTDAAGVYTYTVNGTAPCANAVATVTVNVNTAPNAGSDNSTTVCSSASAFDMGSFLGAHDNGGAWTFGGNPHGNTFTPGTDAAGVYTYTVNGTAPCANAVATVTVGVTTAPNAGSNGSIALCSTSPAVVLYDQLGGTPDNGGHWTFGGNPHGNSFNPGNDTPGVYTYTVDGTAPCADATATVTVSVTTAPNAGSNGNTTVCSTDAAFDMAGLLGAHDNGGAWTFNGNPHGNTFTPGTDAAGVYTYTVSAAPCADAIATVTVNVTNALAWYLDTDGDTFGSGTATMACTSPGPNYVNDNTDDCPTVFGRVGDSCNDGSPFTTNDVLNGSCTCAGTPVPSHNWTLRIVTDANGSETSWEVRDVPTNFLLASGSGLPSNSTVNTVVSIPDAGNFTLKVFDSGNNGIGNGGGYMLRDQNGNRVIDNLGNGAGFTSLSESPEGFFSPVGTDGLRSVDCDNVERWPFDMITASPNPAVSAQWQVGNQTDDGYEFWFTDPNGTYSRHIFRSHATSGGYAPADAQRACKLGLASWTVNPLPQGALLNVRIRGRVNGVNQNFGPACRLKVDVTAANCHTTQLENLAGPNFSCGVVGLRTNGSSRIWAKPVSRYVQATNTYIPANKYRFHFVNIGENTNMDLLSTSYPLLIYPQYGFQLGASYTVTVQASFDNGSTYCPLGASCQISFAATNNRMDAVEVTETSDLLMYPNPNRGDELFLSMAQLESPTGEVTIDVVDMFGKRVMGSTIALANGGLNTKLRLSDGELASGLYLVTITAGEQTITKRLVIQR